MTIEEAKTCSIDELLFHLKWQHKECYCLEERCWQYNDCEYRILLDRIKEALEKQIPKKANMETFRINGLLTAENFYCPSCGSTTIFDGYGVPMNYCSYCGQKIERSEE